MSTLNAKVGDIAMSTTGSGTASLSGWGWQPGFSFGMMTKNTGSTSALFAGLTIGTGFAVGTGTITQYGLWLSQNDAQNPPSTSFLFDSSLYQRIWSDATNAGSLDGQVTVTHDAGGVTLTSGTTTNAPDAAYEETVLGIDSAAIANSKIGNFTSPLSTGNTAVTGVGFKPDLVIFFLTGPGGFTLPHTENAVDANNPNGIMYGATDGTNQWVATCGVASEGGDENPLARRYFLTSKCISGWFWDQNSTTVGGGPTLEIEASITSLDTGGFTLNWSTVDATTNYRIAYVALKMNAGFNVAVGNITTPTSTGTFSKTGMAFKPAALLAMNIGKGASTAGTADSDLELVIGVTDGTNSRCRSWYGQDLNVTTATGGAPAAKSYQDMSNFLSYRVTSGSTAAEAIAFTSFNSDGFTLNSTTAPAAGSATGFIAFGPGAAAGGPTTGEIDAACSTANHHWVPGRVVVMVPTGPGGGRA